MSGQRMHLIFHGVFFSSSTTVWQAPSIQLMYEISNKKWNFSTSRVEYRFFVDIFEIWSRDKIFKISTKGNGIYPHGDICIRNTLDWLYNVNQLCKCQWFCHVATLSVFNALHLFCISYVSGALFRYVVRFWFLTSTPCSHSIHLYELSRFYINRFYAWIT